MLRQFKDLTNNSVRRRMAARIQPMQMNMGLVGPDHPDRKMSEAFVRSIFNDAYNADLKTFYPLLMSITWPDDRYAAIAGIRPASSEPLFSEYYLDRPIEQLLGEKREKIVEIGNLAPDSTGQARWLICTLTSFLSGAGFSQVVFTTVPMLYNAFRRMGMTPVKHADARPERLPADLLREWGSYYEKGPAVYSGSIRSGEQALQALISNDPELRDISRRAFQAGRRFSAQPSVRG